jgi:arylsulfatase A-like enzyme
VAAAAAAPAMMTTTTKRSSLARLLLLQRVVLLCCCSPAASSTSPPPPNIIFNVVDDLGWNDLGYQRGALPGQINAIQSPHIDALAMSGVRLHDYAVFKFCSPSRSQFLVGRYAYHLGQQTKINLPASRPGRDGTCGLPLGYSMVPAVLKKHAPGYISRAYGKWHQGFFNESYTPVGRGFDSFFGFYDGGQSYFTHITPYSVWRDPSTPLFWTPSNFGGVGKGGNVSYPLSPHVLAKDRCGALVDLANDTLDSKTGNIVLRHADSKYNGTHSTELLATQVVLDIESHDKSRPLFVYLAWHAVHDPLEVAPEYTLPYAGKIQDESRRTLAGMISNLDQGVANVTAALRKRDMWKDTLWIMTTDNVSTTSARGHALVRCTIYRYKKFHVDFECGGMTCRGGRCA